ncbi:MULTISPECIES: lipase family protein [unclassified Lysinibacillus]|uniref:lipase family protein n=1 Tax=unclassified Lysinibacillus TaxID=2636778 RepID=UPI00201234E6|nr:MULTISPECIES: lipase family protein [unclassified Lysinibacillus]MCL1696981.1 lipase family protein [Lysinibacillus sp. BPa_S21]MCL1701704.1 lipase family protein [Lysinibacillus sp. Bpr_S20]
MLKKLGFTVLLSAILLLVTFTMGTSKAQAGYTDNPSKLYYDLADQVYNVGKKTNAEIQHAINLEHGPNKFKVIDSVDINSNQNHPMGAPSYNLDRTGFKAMTVVIADPNGSKKLFIAFAGSENVSDYATAASSLLNGSVPGQVHQAHLYLNYIYDKFGYKDYQWYFTGHSLGGWLAAKSYLDVRAGITVVSNQKFTHYGPIKKKKISGVYTFNALPVAKTQMTDTQWTANKNRTYHSDVKNLYIDNEWLNSIHDMHPTKLAYIGEEGAVNKKVPHFTSLSYSPFSPLIDIVNYYRINKNNDIVDYHSRKYLSTSVYH